MQFDTATVPSPLGAVVLLHPHPDFGGNSRHPFVAGLFAALPAQGMAAVRFDFTTSDVEAATGEARRAIGAARDAAPGRPVLIAGYSFGAGIAARVVVGEVAAWYLLAPQAAMLSGSALGADPRPKLVAVPELDQFSPPAALEPVVGGWSATQVEVLGGTDHFLGDPSPIVRAAATWLGTQIPGS